MNNIRDEEVRKQFQREITEKDLKEAYKKSEAVLEKVEKGFLHKEIAKIRLLIMLLKDYYDGVYTEIPWHSIAAIVVVLLYILNPFDLIPDFIPGVGQLDDMAVLAFAWKMISKDIKTYANWKVTNGDNKVAELIDGVF